MDCLVDLILQLFDIILVITVYATLGEDAVAYALKQCDGKIIFTTRNLLKKVAKALESCPDTHTVVYFQELHRPDGDDGFAKPSHEDLFKSMGKKLESFETLLDSDLDGMFNRLRGKFPNWCMQKLVNLKVFYLLKWQENVIWLIKFI
jgi:hypothetical protein